MNHKISTFSGALLALGLLSACGNSSSVSENRDFAGQAKGIFSGLAQMGRAPEPVDEATLVGYRKILEEDGSPAYAMRAPSMNYLSFLSEYGQNGAVKTWSGSNDETLGLRDGILLATRGLGADLMSASAPSLQEVQSGSGFFHRTYYWLDGGDHPVQAEFDCYFAQAGSDSINLMGKVYAARHVTESCSNQKTEFTNSYWFDGSGKLRQSEQYVSEMVGSVQLQRIVD